jgi:hypothetical protein
MLPVYENGAVLRKYSRSASYFLNNNARARRTSDIDMILRCLGFVNLPQMRVVVPGHE